ncbi:MAG: hypothetical protein U0794_03660 [Isosphaeraceae bacterium]
MGTRTHAIREFRAGRSAWHAGLFLLCLIVVTVENAQAGALIRHSLAAEGSSAASWSRPAPLIPDAGVVRLVFPDSPRTTSLAEPAAPREAEVRASATAREGFRAPSSEGVNSNANPTTDPGIPALPTENPATPGQGSNLPDRLATVPATTTPATPVATRPKAVESSGTIDPRTASLHTRGPAAPVDRPTTSGSNSVAAVRSEPSPPAAATTASATSTAGAASGTALTTPPPSSSAAASTTPPTSTTTATTTGSPTSTNSTSESSGTASSPTPASSAGSASGPAGPPAQAVSVPSTPPARVDTPSAPGTPPTGGPPGNAAPGAPPTTATGPGAVANPAPPGALNDPAAAAKNGGRAADAPRPLPPAGPLAASPSAQGLTGPQADAIAKVSVDQTLTGLANLIGSAAAKDTALALSASTSLSGATALDAMKLAASTLPIAMENDLPVPSVAASAGLAADAAATVTVTLVSPGFPAAVPEPSSILLPAMVVAIMLADRSTRAVRRRRAGS